MMSADPGSSEKKIALIGANGMLAGMIRARAPQNYTLHLFDLPDFNMTDREQVFAEIPSLSPDVIINCAAFTNVDVAEAEQEIAMAVNGTAVGYLAEVARTLGAPLVHISTDYVFDGQKTTPYLEADATNPQSVYGRTKLAGEQAIRQSGLEKYFIIRTSWLYGPGGNNFVETIMRLAAEREELRIISDQVGAPTYTGDMANAVFALLEASTCPQSPGPSPYGTYHFANEGQCSWYDFAKEILKVSSENGFELKVREVLPIITEEYPLPATRPAFSVFNKQKYQKLTGCKIPEWQDSLREYFKVRIPKNS